MVIYMENQNIYHDIAQRTGGDIYIGVVGPVRTGKSTFIKKFMETLVIPNMQSDFMRERATDELPQSAAGKTIMTTEPKFIPEEAVEVELEGNAALKVRLIDCVGYIVPSYEEAEERVISELKGIRKPYIILLNTQNPNSQATRELQQQMEEKYQKPVYPVNCLDLNEEDIKGILQKILFEFPLKEAAIELPRWIISLDKDHWLKRAVFEAIKEAASGIRKISEVSSIGEKMCGCEHITKASVDRIDLGKGQANITITLQPQLFYQILGEATGLQIDGEAGLMPCMIELAACKREYDKLKGALDEVAATGYGIVMPTMEELSLEEPEIVKQGGKYGVKLRASAPSIHMMRADITTEVSPIVGSEKQSEELVMFLLKEFEENPKKIWESNIFGKSLHELVNEGLHNKLYRMPTDARLKLQETIERIINDGCNGLVCLIL